MSDTAVLKIEAQQAGATRRVSLQLPPGYFFRPGLEPHIWAALSQVIGLSQTELSDVRTAPLATVHLQHIAVSLLAPELAEPVANLLEQIAAAGLHHRHPDEPIDGLPDEQHSRVRWLSGERPEGAHEIETYIRRQAQQQWRSDIGGWSDEG